MKLKGEHIHLRAIEPADLDFLYELENNPDIWEVSGTITPYSKHILKSYLENAHRDIFDVKQLRLCICNKENRVIGLIDLFDFDPKNKRAGIGIVIGERTDRNKGYGEEALTLLCEYAFQTLQLRQLYANVGEDNAPSIHLFQKLGFSESGRKIDWIYSRGTYKDELLFQKINK